MSIFCHPHYYPWCTSTSTLSAVGLSVTSLTLHPPSCTPRPWRFSSLLSPQERHTLVLVVVNSHSIHSIQNVNQKLVFICYLRGRSFLITQPQSDPHSSLHPCNFTFLRPFFSRSTFSHSYANRALLQPDTSLALFLIHHSHSLSFSFSPSLPSRSGLGLIIVQSVEDGPSLLD